MSESSGGEARNPGHAFAAVRHDGQSNGLRPQISHYGRRNLFWKIGWERRASLLMKIDAAWYVMHAGLHVIRTGRHVMHTRRYV